MERLMEEEVAESKNLEYKGSLDLSINDHKRKLLITSSAFANTNGGLLIYGIKAKDGIPTELTGVTIDSEDKTGIQIEDTIRNNSEPRIPSIEIGFIQKTGTENYYILVKVQQSWNSPHRVKLGGSAGKFYLRRDRKNDEMDIFELRNAFDFSVTLADKIKRFREERISNILTNKTPIPLFGSGKIVLHLIPLNAFYPGQSYDIHKMDDGRLGLIYEDLNRIRYNFDGILEYEQIEEDEGETSDYAQLFRNGIIEAVTTTYCNHEKKTITSKNYEIAIINALKGYFGIYRKLNVEYPVFIFITLVDVKGYQMGRDKGSRRMDYVIDRDVLAVPEIILKKYPDSIENEIKPIFDTIRNACGFKESRSYDNKGNWRY